MATVEDLFCARENCDQQQFRRRLFRECLYAPARAALSVGGFDSDFFQPDRDLIADIAQARSAHDIKAAIEEFHSSTPNRSFARKYLKMRVSTTKLRELTMPLFSTGEHAPPRRRRS